MSNRLKELRKKQNLTLHDLELKTGIRDVNLSRYEREIVQPKPDTWKKLADFFHVSVPYIQGLDNQAENYMGAFVSSLGSETDDNKDKLVNSFSNINDLMLKNSLYKLQRKELRPMEPFTLTVAIDLVTNFYDTYDFKSRETEDFFVVLAALNQMIKNTVDDDDEYQDTIETFTKLVNNLKAQNKKASDN
ncbi:helix-turn-helix domain-containing protein [Leuconostoc citreum]